MSKSPWSDDPARCQDAPSGLEWSKAGRSETGRTRVAFQTAGLFSECQVVHVGLSQPVATYYIVTIVIVLIVPKLRNQHDLRLIVDLGFCRGENLLRTAKLWEPDTCDTNQPPESQRKVLLIRSWALGISVLWEAH